MQIQLKIEIIQNYNKNSNSLPDSGSIIGIAFARRFFCCPSCCWDAGGKGSVGGGTCCKFCGADATT